MDRLCSSPALMRHMGAGPKEGSHRRKRNTHWAIAPRRSHEPDVEVVGQSRQRIQAKAVKNGIDVCAALLGRPTTHTRVATPDGGSNGPGLRCGPSHADRRNHTSPQRHHAVTRLPMERNFGDAEHYIIASRPCHLEHTTVVARQVIALQHLQQEQ